MMTASHRPALSSLSRSLKLVQRWLLMQAEAFSLSNREKMTSKRQWIDWMTFKSIKLAQLFLTTSATMLLKRLHPSSRMMQPARRPTTLKIFQRMMTNLLHCLPPSPLPRRSAPCPAEPTSRLCRTNFRRKRRLVLNSRRNWKS